MGKKKIKKVVKKQQAKLTSRMGLVDHSPYLRSLLDPINSWGAKIPDTQTAPSFCVHCVQRVQVTVGSGVGGTPCAGIFMQIGDLRTAGQLSSTVQGGTTPTGLVNTTYNKTYANTVATVTQALRPVSAAVYMAYQGSPLNAKGRVSVALIPPTQTGVTLQPVDINADVQALPYMSTLPANAGFAQVKYLPIDPLSKSYTLMPGPFVRGGNATYASTYGALYILLDGGTVGDIVEFTVVENFECLPQLQGTNLSSPTPSKSDPFEMAAVDNLIATRPNLAIAQSPDSTIARTAVTTAQQAAIPVQHDPKKHESGLLEKIMNGIGVGLDFVEKQAPKVARIASIAAPLLL